MGNNSTKSNTGPGSEMSSARHFERPAEEHKGPLCPLPELDQDCVALREGVQDLAFAIDDIFEERGVLEGSRDGLENTLHGMTRLNQSLILKLIVQLERHAKEVHAGQEQNEHLMSTVRLLVDIVNRYMAMLELNIRKLKRLISEMDASQASRQVSRRPHRALYLPQTSSRHHADLVCDVISDQQDVDSMLLQLIHTRAHREELEGDMVTVLVFWRDYRYIREQETDDGVIERIGENVLAAADSVTAGLSQLNKKR